MGAVLVKAGGTQLVLTDGAVPLPFPERSFFYILGRLASLPTEKRLGVSDENAAASCSGDTEGVKQTMKLETGDAEEDAKRAMMLFGVALLAGLFVCHTRVWQAIEQTAGLLLQKGKIQGEEVRQIVRQHIPEHIFFSEERQRNIWQEGGPPVAIMKALQEEQAKEAA